MKKLKNKFILGVISIIALIVSLQVFLAYSNHNVDTNSYLTLIKWNATLNEVRLEADTKNILASGDKVRVIGESSLALIEWWDGSLTRLGGNTKISIDQNQISKDYTNINISFELIAGKTWSNVVSFIGKDSSFTQTFDGIEAWVRGTIFDVDLEKKFIHVSDHAVDLTDTTGNVLRIAKGEVLSVNDFTFVEFSEFLSSLQDDAWKQLNEQFDSEHIAQLKEKFELSLQDKNPFVFILSWISPKYALLYKLDTSKSYESVSEYIESLSESKKKDLYNDVLSKYQSMNVISWEDTAAYNKKLFYKRALIDLSPDSTDTKRLLESSVYDLQDIVDSGSTEWLTSTLHLLNDNSSLISDVDMSFLQGGLEYIPEDLLEEFKSSFGQLEDILDIDFSRLKNINSDSIWNALNEADWAIQNFLEDNVWGLLKKVTQ